MGKKLFTITKIIVLCGIVILISQCKKPKKSSIELNNLGIKFQQKNQYDSAELYFLKAINSDSTYKTPYRNLISLSLFEKKYEYTLSIIKVFLKLPDLSGFDRSSIDYESGIAFYCMGRTDSATERWMKYDNYYRLKAEESSKYEDEMQRIPVLIWLGKNSEAVEVCNKIKKEHPDKSEIIDELFKNSDELLPCRKDSTR